VTGRFFAASRSLGIFERIYIFLFGFPILGMRIRSWHMMPLIRRYARPDGRLLDLGSGRGIFTIEMARIFRKARVVGTELNMGKAETSGKLAKKMGLTNCSFMVRDVLKNPPKEKVDCVVAIDVLEHIKDDRRCLKQLNRLLNPRGRCIIHVPHKFRNCFGRRRLNFDIEGHFRPGYLMPGLESMVRAAGFRVLEKGYTYSSLETLANDLSYFITRGREKNKLIYSLAFPFLLAIAAAGSGIRPSEGSGVYLVAEKK
jgi:ubiquinone/menaquinone biosynthesis C-methylase UbiE